MGTRTVYLCPHCNADINGQTLLPPTTRHDSCRACGGKVLRSGGSIRDAWGSSFIVFGFVPVWLVAALAVASSGPKGGLLAAAFIGFFVALVPGTIGLNVLGWVCGLFVSAFAPDAPAPARMTASDLGALQGAMHEGHRWKQKWNG